MNEDDLPATQLMQPGSRLRHAQLFAGPRTEIAAFKEWLETNKKANEEIEDVEDSAPQIKSAIDRSARFLSIASLVAVLLCSIAVAMAARRYVQRHLDSVALLKTLGATRGFTLTVSLTQLVIIGVCAASWARPSVSARRPGWSRSCPAGCAVTCRPRASRPWVSAS
jgi:putative ABC transport system permease protein